MIPKDQLDRFGYLAAFYARYRGGGGYRKLELEAVEFAHYVFDKDIELDDIELGKQVRLFNANQSN